MAKCIDITEKLSFDKNPALIIKGRKFIVNADAGTMLEIMGFSCTGLSGREIFASMAGTHSASIGWNYYSGWKSI